MSMSKPGRNSNLFYIDLTKIEPTLEDANQPLIEACEKLLGNVDLLPKEIASNDDAEQVREFLKDLRKQIKLVASNRLSDGRSFADAHEVVKKWFSKIEERLKIADKLLSENLSTYASDAFKVAEEIRQRNLVRREEANVAEQDVIGSTLTGETLVTINKSTENASSNQEEEPETPDVELVWRVASYDRQELDLEMLRPYLTDFALRNAINSYLKENDHKTLAGVHCEQVLSKKL